MRNILMTTVAAAALASSPVYAQADGAGAGDGAADGAGTNDEETTVEKLTEFLEALVGVQGEQGNQITPADNTGQFEVDVLAVRALTNAARAMTTQLCPVVNRTSPCAGKKILVVTEDEGFSFGVHNALSIELNAFGSALEGLIAQNVPPEDGQDNDKDDVGMLAAAGLSPLAFVDVFSQLAALVRNERTLASISTTAADSELLALAMASHLNETGIGVTSHVLGSSPGARLEQPEDEVDISWETPGQVAHKMAFLLTIYHAAKADDQLPDNIKPWVESFEAFFTRITATEDGKQSELATAIETESIETDLAGVLVVDVGAVGGTRTTSKNFGTVVLGLDPFRVAGGITASFTYFDAEANQRARPVAMGSVTCSTDDIRLDDVRNANFSEAGGDAVCSPVNLFGGIPKPVATAETEATPETDATQ